MLVALGGVLLVMSWLAAHPVVLVLLLAGGGAGTTLFLRRRQREQRRAAALRDVRAREIAAYHAMSPRQFEEAIAYLCTRDGCRDVRVVGGAGDLGADVIATTPDGRRIVVQCKRYGPASSVGSGDVQKVNGTYRDAHGAHLAAIVTTSRFTGPARDFALRVGIRPFDEAALAAWASGTGPAPWA
ncbi:restriction endonuclease [Streptomyces sp. ICBB 8177]|uniref:restriction endonuclease n=1 Tax=Streptomyces sp. ICBB 8177 TaxID=563922 RepID=UPI001F545A1F|nr:restriction endonuclease [Streptomyces sp. ICBB 8177]